MRRRKRSPNRRHRPRLQQVFSARRVRPAIRHSVGRAQHGLTAAVKLLASVRRAAVGAAMGGLSWTEAAQNWGFADSAHLSRTCQRMFGIAPTMLIRE